MSDTTYRDKIRMTKENWKDGVTTGMEKAKKDHGDFIRDTIDGKRDSDPKFLFNHSPRLIDAEKPAQVFKWVTEGSPTDFYPTGRYTIQLNEGKKMKVYEGILVKLEDGKIVGIHGITTRKVATNPQRARDLMVRALHLEIDEIESSDSDWDIIVREWK